MGKRKERGEYELGFEKEPKIAVPMEELVGRDVFGVVLEFVDSFAFSNRRDFVNIQLVCKSWRVRVLQKLEFRRDRFEKSPESLLVHLIEILRIFSSGGSIRFYRECEKAGHLVFALGLRDSYMKEKRIEGSSFSGMEKCPISHVHEMQYFKDIQEKRAKGRDLGWLRGDLVSFVQETFGERIELLQTIGMVVIDRYPLLFLDGKETPLCEFLRSELSKEIGNFWIWDMIGVRVEPELYLRFKWKFYHGYPGR